MKLFNRLFLAWLKRRDYVFALQSRIAELEMQLFESQQFERIASGKLEVWVKKHDELLIKYKELTHG